MIKILRNLCKLGGPMQKTTTPEQTPEPTGKTAPKPANDLAALEQESQRARRRVEELKGRMTEIRRRIDAGMATEDEHLEFSDVVERVKAADKARGGLHQRVARMRREAQRAGTREQLEEVMTRIGDLVPRVMWELTRLEEVTRMDGFEEELAGVPRTFASDLLAAIRQAAPRTDWDFAFLDGVPNERPRMRPETTVHFVMAERDIYGNVIGAGHARY